MKKIYLIIQSMAFCAIVTFAGLTSCTNGSGNIKDPDRDDYLFGHSMEYPLREIKNVFSADNKQAFFTEFNGFSDISVIDGKLYFTLTADTGILGWGNYHGKQAIGDVQNTFQECGKVVLKIKQTSDKSNWKLSFYRDGNTDPIENEGVITYNPSGLTGLLKSYQTVEQNIYQNASGTDWQELAFVSPVEDEPWIKIPEAKFDAMGFMVTGEPGTQFQLEWVQLVQPEYSGYCRKEFEIPEGRIWSAVANVGSMNYRNWHIRNETGLNTYHELWSTLYINGEKVEREGARDLYSTAPVDITKYLKSGKNCVGFYGSGISFAPFLYFQTKVIMESGEVVEFSSDPDWKYSPDHYEGWSNPGFDDSGWRKELIFGKGPWVDPWDMAGDFGIPAYSGRLVIVNPGERDLFYSSSDSVFMDVLVPSGLSKDSPELLYYFGRSDSKGVSSLVSKGTVENFENDSVNLIYHIAIGQQSDGIYSLALRLKDGKGNVIEERSREPVVILKRLDLKTVTGESSTEGLDIELEDVVDFTDPDDPHPSKELHAGGMGVVKTPPVIKRIGSMVYREVTDSLRGAGFSYNIEFKHPGDFYYFELEYPDDKQRIVEVMIKSMVNAKARASCQSGLGVETGGRFLPTNKMQTLSWIHIADPGPHRVDIASSMDNEKAAAKSLKIYHVKGNLPAIRNENKRHYGIHTERDYYDTGVGKNFGTIEIKNGEIVLRGRLADRDLEISLQEQERRASEKINSVPLIQSALENLYWLKDMGENYVQYLKYTGQNAHIMGCYQYSDYNSPSIFALPYEDSRILNCTRTMLANMFELNDIDFYAGVEFSQSQDVKTYANDALVAQGAKSAYMIDSEGNQMYGFYTSFLQNWLYPETQEKYCFLLERLGRTYGHLSHFKGVHNFTGIDTRSGGYWMPGMGVGSHYDNPLLISYDDVTMKRFEKETGTNLGISYADTDRFSKRAEFLKNNSEVRSKFLSWRSDMFKDLISDGITSLRKGSNRDADLLNILQMPDFRLFQYLYSSGKPVKEITSEMGYDIDKVNSIDGVWTGRWTIGWRHWYPRPPHRNPYTWMARTDPSVISAFERDSNRFVFIRTSWDENTYDDALIRTLPQPSGYNCREAFIQAVVTGDPELIVGGYTDLNMNIGFEQILREVIQPFTMLPEEKFTPVLSTGITTNVAIRQLNKDDQSYFYIANPCQWDVSGSITVDNQGEIIDLVSGNIIQVNDGEMKFALKPFGLLAYRSSSPDLYIARYKTDPISDEDLNRLSGVIEQFKYNVHLENGLEPDDIAFLKPFITDMDKAMKEHEYSKAWSLLTEPRVWTLKTMLEKM